VSEVLQFAKIQELIYALPIRRVMRNPVVSVAPDSTMSELREVLRLNRISGVPVVEGDRLVGVISIEDMLKALLNGETSARVGEKMTRQPITVREDESVVEAVRLFSQHKVGRLLVVDPAGELSGILTGGDITRGVLKAISLDPREEEERTLHRARHIFEDVVSDQSSLILRYQVRVGDFDSAGSSSSKLRRAFNRLGLPPEVVRRASISAYEAEMNLVIHSSHGGEIVTEVQPGSIRIVVTDSGPGIPDTEKALTPGFSTAPLWIRELGFGAGMGLPNIRNFADRFTLESTVGSGTKLDFLFEIAG
jgi:CBS domain-containing protein/anti-sigma regulatory factor (Ser/Thr protein kinase)